MRNVRQQCEIPLAAFDQARYEFCHNANLRLGELMRRLALVCATAAAVGSTPVQSASIYTISPKMRSDVACMYDELKKVPGIDRVKTGAFEWQGWVYPYLEYRAAPDANGFRPIVRFVAEQDCKIEPNYSTENFDCVPHPGPYGFTAGLSGLSAEGTEPNDGGTTTVEERWRARCRVDVGTLFV
jgi:hypothetical protein